MQFGQLHLKTLHISTWKSNYFSVSRLSLVIVLQIPLSSISFTECADHRTISLWISIVRRRKWNLSDIRSLWNPRLLCGHKEAPAFTVAAVSIAYCPGKPEAQAGSICVLAKPVERPAEALHAWSDLDHHIDSGHQRALNPGPLYSVPPQEAQLSDWWDKRRDENGLTCEKKFSVHVKQINNTRLISEGRIDPIRWRWAVKSFLLLESIAERNPWPAVPIPRSNYGE